MSIFNTQRVCLIKQFMSLLNIYIYILRPILQEPAIPAPDGQRSFLILMGNDESIS